MWCFLLSVMEQTWQPKSRKWSCNACSSSTSPGMLKEEVKRRNVLFAGGGSVTWACYRYCAGTMPWGHPSEHQDFEPQRHDDGCIEVIGFTMTSLVSSRLSSATASTDISRPREHVKWQSERTLNSVTPLWFSTFSGFTEVLDLL